METARIPPEVYWSLIESILGFIVVNDKRSTLRLLAGTIAIAMPTFLLGVGLAGNSPELVNVAAAESFGLLAGAFLGAISRIDRGN